MPEIYAKQRKFFKKAYETGEHGWPEVGPTAHVAKLVGKLGSGAGKAALDLGCGEGRHTILLGGRGYEVTALDLEPLALTRSDDGLLGAWSKKIAEPNGDGVAAVPPPAPPAPPPPVPPTIETPLSSILNAIRSDPTMTGPE
jgi:SAM-dependent methyltransferase